MTAHVLSSRIIPNEGLCAVIDRAYSTGHQSSLLRSSLEALRNHRDGKNFIPLLRVCDSVQRLLVLPAKGDSNQRKGCLDFAEKLPTLIDHLNAIRQGTCRVNASQR